MKHNYTDENIEQYIRGTLDEPLRSEMTQYIAQNEEFAQEVEIYKATLDAFWVQGVVNEDKDLEINEETTFGEVTDLERNAIMMDLHNIEAELKGEGFFEEDDTDIIAQYIDGKLTEEQQKEVEKRMETDKNFAREVKIQRAITNAAQVKRIIEEKQAKSGDDKTFKVTENTTFGEIKQIDRENIKTDLRQVEDELKKEQFFEKKSGQEGAKVVELGRGGVGIGMRRRFLRWAGAAACVAVLVLAFFLIPRGSSSGGDMFANNFEPYEDILTQDLNNGAASNERTKSVMDGLDAYNKKDYGTAVTLFEKQIADYPDKVMDNRQVEFYIALSHLSDNQPDKALPILERLEKETGFQYATPTSWYLALTYLKKDKKDQAKPLLEKLKSDKEFGGKASKLLGGLE